MDINIFNYPMNYKRIIYLAGRNCYGLEVNDDISDIHDNELNLFINKIIKNKHDSILEHINVSFYVHNCTRSFMSQITRHRLCAFAVKSQHFVNHNDFTYKQLPAHKNISNSFIIEYNELMENIRNFYKKMSKNAVPYYIARGILPNSCLTNIFITANVRELRYIINLRIQLNNVPEMILFSKLLLDNLYSIMPELFIDIKTANEVI